MIAAILTALAAMIEPAPGGAAAPASPPVAAQKSALQQAHDSLDQAQQIYNQSCGDRAYGAYDDLCDQISIQVRKYHIEVDKLERAADQAPPPVKTKPNL